MAKELQAPVWTDVLDAVKALPQIAEGSTDQFTVAEVFAALESRFAIDPKKTGQWVSKFVEWGYVQRGEFQESQGRGRPARTYHLLPKALKERTGRPSQLSRLILAIYDVQGATTETTPLALQALYKVRDEIEEEIANRFQRKP